MHFQFGKGWEPKLIRMYVAFDWVEISGSKLVERCRVSGATVMQVCASVSVGVSERWMKVKGTCGIWYQHDTRDLLGGRGHPSSQMQRIMHIIEIMFKIHFSRL